MRIIHFKIESKKNRNIYQSGYVEIPDDIEESADWFYYNQTGMAQPSEFTHHDEIGVTQIGATNAQIQEIDSFLEQIHVEHVEWVHEIILNAEENEQGIYKKGDLKIVINEE